MVNEKQYLDKEGFDRLVEHIKSSDNKVAKKAIEKVDSITSNGLVKFISNNNEVVATAYMAASLSNEDEYYYYGETIGLWDELEVSEESEEQ